MTTHLLAPDAVAPREAHRGAPGEPPRGMAVACVVFGCALTLAMEGYQFGQSNHTVYLLDAVRHLSPGTLRNDWFTTQTLHYHAAFGLLTRGLMAVGLLQAGFLIGYLALLVLLHTAWWKISRALGAGVAIFLLSETLFHLLAGGTALGMYQFLQDASFLPSNIASVAMLWGIYFWMTGRRGWSVAVFGFAGVVHLNYAVIAPIIWLALWIESRWRDGRRLALNDALGALAMIELCLMNIIPAAIFMREHPGHMPLDQFIDLYVKLRHPHHYDPLHWPIALWASFLVPIPFAWLAWRKTLADELNPRLLAATRSAMRIVVIILVMLLIALLTAGIWYISETIVHLSLWRFSVFVKLLTCIGLAMWFERIVRRDGAIALISSAVGVAIIIACAVRGPYLGFFKMPGDPPSYLAACDWIRAHTPADAVFLVPPDEQEFRLRARRAIVVNYKCVPQLSQELAQWRDRLQDVLMLNDLRSLPTPFTATLTAIRRRYESLPPVHYAEVARQYGARYVLVGHRLPGEWERRRIDIDHNESWFLYDLSRE